MVNPTLTLPGTEVFYKAKTVFPDARVEMLDGTYYYTSAHLWPYILKHAKLKAYKKKVQDRYDCEDFAMWLKVFIAAEFGLNGVHACIGPIFGNGRHGFNLVLTDQGYLYCEPQGLVPGLWTLSQNDGFFHYRPELILL